MTRARLISALRRFLRDEDGASLIEYAIVISLYLLVFFAIIGGLKVLWSGPLWCFAISNASQIPRPALAPRTGIA